MWNDVGIVRSGAGLRKSVHQTCEDLLPASPIPRPGAPMRRAISCTAGLLVARSALAREESRGAHYRTDFPPTMTRSF